MSLMLDREQALEAEHAEKESFGRTAARVLLLSVVVTALIAGLYMVFGGSTGADPLAGAATTNPAPAAAGPEQAAPAKPKPLTYEEKAVALAATLPKNASTGDKRSALITYAKQVGIKITPQDSPATAATQICGFLDKGTSISTMVNEFARGSGYDKQHTRAFMLGATTLYCPSYAKNFR